MNFISSLEASKNWGISQRRISILASQGKIPGAKKVANNWLIPSEASKPLDGRYNINKKINESSFPFRFPIYSFSVPDNKVFIDTLSKDEKKVLKYEKMFNANTKGESYPYFEELLNKTPNPFVRMSCLYHLAFIDMLTQNFDLFDKHYKSLKEYVSKYSKQYPSLIYIQYDIELIIKGNISFTRYNDYETKVYDRSAYSYITALEFYQNVFSLLGGEGNVELSFYECMILNYENSGYYFVVEYMHIYIAIMYVLLKKDELVLSHLKKAIDIGIEHKIYSILAEHYNYLIEYMDKVLKDYPEDTRNKIVNDNRMFINSVNSIAEHFVGTKVQSLNVTDYKYIAYALRDTPNKVIALNLGVSESRISAKYSQLAEKFNVSSKQELVAKIKGSLVNPYLIIN